MEQNMNNVHKHPPVSICLRITVVILLFYGTKMDVIKDCVHISGILL